MAWMDLWSGETRNDRHGANIGFPRGLIVGAAGGVMAAMAAIAAWWGALSLASALFSAAVAMPLGLFLGFLCECHRWRAPIRTLTEQVNARTQRGNARPQSGRSALRPATPELAALVRAIDELDRWLEDRAPGDVLASLPSLQNPTPSPSPALTRSGLYEPPSNGSDRSIDAQTSGYFDTVEMVGRLDPSAFHWLEASPALQAFLGAGPDRLRRTSLLELIHPDDRESARRQLREAPVRGEVLGLVYRLGTMDGRRKAVELNLGVRYGPDGSVAYLRCHVTDVTDRIRARREQRRRTRELIKLNDDLRRANRELAELKDRYGDLYQNAPAMYFSLDARGCLLVCNDTLLRTLGYRRRELLGRPYTDLLPEELRGRFEERFRQFLLDGHMESETQWMTAAGRRIDVMVKGTAVRDASGRLLHSRSIAQDITTRKTLEVELRRNNERLALANAALSRKNKELDEFTYVVSHDLQEPLRTLIAFSGFLRQDCADRLDPQGLEYLDYLTDASIRMRALIHGLLDLSRAGRSVADFGPVPLEELLAVLKADHAELIRSRRATFRVVSKLPTLWGDRDRLGQLFGNLICNSLKYNQSEEPRVEVGVVPDRDGDGRFVTLFVRDNGIGIDPQFHQKIFQMFRRLHPRDRYEGTGAGLAICQKIVQAHGGRIGVDSRLGEGATFFMTLPLAPTVVPTDRPAPPDRPTETGRRTEITIGTGTGSEPQDSTAPNTVPDNAIHAR